MPSGQFILLPIVLGFVEHHSDFAPSFLAQRRLHPPVGGPPLFLKMD